MTKKDSGQWELLKRNSKEAANQDVLRLKNLINFNAIPKREDVSLQLSTKYKIYKGYKNAEFTWKNILGSGPYFLGVFATAYLLAAIVIYKITSSMGIMVYFVFGFMAIIYTTIVVVTARRMYKHAKTEYSILINETELSYVEKDFLGKSKRIVSVPLSEIHAISFSFDTDISMRKIFIYTHEQFERKKTLKPSLSIDYYTEMYKLQRELIALDLMNLTAVEALYVETFLQQQIMRN
jgi:hypothetical protein